MIHGVRNELASAVAVSGVDFFLGGAAQMRKVVVDDALVFGAPVTVPDDVHGRSFLKYRATVVVNVAGVAIAVRWRMIVAIRPQGVRSVVLGESAACKTHCDHDTQPLLFHLCFLNSEI